MSAESVQPAAIWYTTVDVMLVCVCVCPGIAEDRAGFPHSNALCHHLSFILARSRRIFELFCLPATGNLSLAAHRHTARWLIIAKLFLCFNFLVTGA